MIEINILVVASDEAIIEAAKESFHPLGYQVIPAHSVSLGLFLAQKNFPELILCQLHLKEGDGLSFLSELHLDEELVPIPFVFVERQDDKPRERREMESSAAATTVAISDCGSLDTTSLLPLIEERLRTKEKRKEYSPE